MSDEIHLDYFVRQVLRSLALGTFYTGVIITSANSKDGRPYGGRNMVAPAGLLFF